MPTLEEARNKFEEGLPEGAICPCCDRYSKIYVRTITSAMARGLIELAIHRKHEWTHLADYFKSRQQLPSSISSGGDMARLRSWGLLIKSQDEKGLFRLTRKGMQFAFGKVVVTKNLHFHNNENIGGSEEQIHISESLRNHFDYDELMRAHPSIGGK